MRAADPAPAPADSAWLAGELARLVDRCNGHGEALPRPVAVPPASADSSGWLAAEVARLAVRWGVGEGDARPNGQTPRPEPPAPPPRRTL